VLVSSGLFRERAVIKLKINGAEHQLDVEPDAPLLWVLRDEIGLKGTKFGCGVASCGACTVHINGVAIRSCVMPVSAVVGKEITTIEGLTETGSTAVQLAWITNQVPQCGYCQSGMIMAVSALLKANPKPSQDELDSAVSNICRCGTYVRIRKAVAELSAAAKS
jgi:isoquinoline 1-oxidoreductase alpha subunit